VICVLWYLLLAEENQKTTVIRMLTVQPPAWQQLTMHALAFVAR
jgi:hypothetical protein